MKKTKSLGSGVSLPTEVKEKAQRRIARMTFPITFSAYVQRLVHLDLERSLLNKDGGVNTEVVGKGQRPDFELTPSVSFRAVAEMA